MNKKNNKIYSSLILHAYAELNAWLDYEDAFEGYGHYSHFMYSGSIEFNFFLFMLGIETGYFGMEEVDRPGYSRHTNYIGIKIGIIGGFIPPLKDK